VKGIFLAILALFSVPLHAQKTLADGIKELATQITTSAAKQEKQRIAVLPFHELDGQPTVLGTYLAEELVTNLFQLGNFKIVERQLLDKVMGELRIEQSGAIDPKTAKEIGRIAAVDAIVTGSITDLESFVAVNCRLIDTTTGEVFGAAQTKITKDNDVKKIMTTALVPGSTTASGTGMSYQASRGIATKEVGSLRVVLKSVLPMKLNDRNGQSTNGMKCTLEFINRDARRPLVVALNAEAWRDFVESHNQYSTSITPLRSSMLDDRGAVWTLSAGDLGGLGFVRVGVHGRLGQEMYSASEIVKLLQVRDQIGKDEDNPSDGTSDINALPYATYCVPPCSPATFFPFKGNRFVSGSTTTIEPGQSITATMSFHQEAGLTPSSARATFFQLNSEIVVAVAEGSTQKSYSLHNLTFDRVSMPPF
jgi:curli biogenesis system outer membrane secretion channel CsgG